MKLQHRYAEKTEEVQYRLQVEINYDQNQNEELELQRQQLIEQLLRQDQVRQQEKMLREIKVEPAQEKAIQEIQVKNQAISDQIRKDKNAQINAINDQLANALVQLRSRPSRSQYSTNNGQDGTGRSLSAEDAGFLIREATRADQIRIALDACYKQYDGVNK